MEKKNWHSAGETFLKPLSEMIETGVLNTLPFVNAFK